MDFNAEGWLERYLKFRNSKTILSPYSILAEKAHLLTKEQMLYRIVQPTGIMYGHPVGFPGFELPELEELTFEEKLKIVLTEVFINCAMFFDPNGVDEDDDQTDEIEFFFKSIEEYYGIFHPDWVKDTDSLLGRRKAGMVLIEALIEKQIDIKANWSNFFESFFQNSLLFVDIVYFFEWMQSDRALSTQKLREDRNDYIHTILKIIAAASNADDEQVTSEKNLFEHFLQSARLSSKAASKARGYFQYGIDIKLIEFDKIESWLQRKYLLELAVLMVWADQKTADAELEFLENLYPLLSLTEEDYLGSAAAVEAFLLQYSESIHYLQDKNMLQRFSNRLIDRLSKIVKKNQRKISKEIAESKELMQLLAKSRKQELTPEENEKMRQQLLDVLKTIPMFIILVLPGSFIALPILMKIIPKNILYPSSFQD